ncbi:MAG: N-6 DNA methylase [Candidatus Gastranaerophilales bacterium]|nr:N-6 DNA methylase [Candidatus Gastranaerophilales bacterium]
MPYDNGAKTGIVVSKATIRNWEKLHTKAAGRLTSRANKRRSTKRILPWESISNKENVALIQTVLEDIDEHGLDIMSAIFSLGISLLKSAGIYEKRHVRAVLSEYADIAVVGHLAASCLPDNEFDLLGLIYQSYLQEGKKNTIGSYYTPPPITHNMTKNFEFSKGKLFFDPCCGSGAFLLSVAATNPCQVFGVDCDKIAVLIAKINLLLKYREFDFYPQVYCLDYLTSDSVMHRHPVLEKRFDYIATNPPWGAMETDIPSVIPVITSKETFSCFFVKAYGQLKKDGIIRFLFPEAILNVKVHKDIRKFILDTAGLVSITVYEELFSGVTTKYIDMACGLGADQNAFAVYAGHNKRTVDRRTIYETENLVLNLLSDEDLAIVRLVKEKGCYSLQNSVWALGIVTGDNKHKLSAECLAGMEKIYTGKEIQPYVLRSAKNYILYDRNALQQVAKEEIYRAPEKLVYKFISNKLVFAYDDQASLFLNSANILIPAIPSMSAKAVMAFLNSPLFQFMYQKLFGEVKVLKGNLMELPFPKISERENDKLTALVDGVLQGDLAKVGEIENYIFALYGLTDDQITYIRRGIDGRR